jgi:hypothetical protein
MRDLPARRRRRRSVVALGAGVFLAAVALVLWPRADRPLLPPDHGAVTVAVLPVDNATGAVAHDWVELGLARLVGEVLAVRPGVVVVPLSESRARLAAAGLRSDAVLDAETMEQLRTGLGADVLVSARLLRAGDGVELRALVRASEGREAALRVRASWLPEAAEDLVTALTGRLSLAAPDPRKGAGMPADPYATVLCGMGLQLAEDGEIEAALRHLGLCLERAPGLEWATRAADECRERLGDEGEGTQGRGGAEVQGPRPH